MTPEEKIKELYQFLPIHGCSVRLGDKDVFKEVKILSANSNTESNGNIVYLLECSASEVLYMNHFQYLKHMGINDLHHLKIGDEEFQIHIKSVVIDVDGIVTSAPIKNTAIFTAHIYTKGFECLPCDRIEESLDELIESRFDILDIR